MKYLFILVFMLFFSYFAYSLDEVLFLYNYKIDQGSSTSITQIENINVNKIYIIGETNRSANSGVIMDFGLYLTFWDVDTPVDPGGLYITKHFDLYDNKDFLYPLKKYSKSYISQNGFVTIIGNMAKTKFGGFPYPKVMIFDTNCTKVFENVDTTSIFRTSLASPIPPIEIDNNKKIFTTTVQCSLNDSILHYNLVKFDEKANYLWEKEFYSCLGDTKLHDNYYIGKFIEPTSMDYFDGNFYITGYVRNIDTFETLYSQACLWKVDTLGNLKWFKNIVNDASNDTTYIYDNLLIQNDSLVIIGHKMLSNADLQKGIKNSFVKILNIDKGNEVGYFEYKKSTMVRHNDFIRTSDNGYLSVGGIVPVLNNITEKNQSNYYALKLTKKFQFDWDVESQYSTTNTEYFNSVVEFTPKTYILGGAFDDRSFGIVLKDKSTGISIDGKDGIDINVYQSNSELRTDLCLKNSSNVTIEISTILGEKLFSKDFGYLAEGEQSLSISSLNYPKGAYFVSVITNVGQFTKKVILE